MVTKMTARSAAAAGRRFRPTAGIQSVELPVRLPKVNKRTAPSPGSAYLGLHPTVSNLPLPAEGLQAGPNAGNLLLAAQGY